MLGMDADVVDQNVDVLALRDEPVGHSSNRVETCKVSVVSVHASKELPPVWQSWRRRPLSCHG
jgi:hypothetical protein